MLVDLQGRALALLNKVAGAEWPDRLRLRKPLERWLYRGSKASFSVLAQQGGAAKRARPNKPASPRGVFDLTLSDDQQLLCDMLQQVAQDVVRPAAAEANAAQHCAEEVRAALAELGLKHYGVPAAHGGLADEAAALTCALMTEQLAHGDPALALVALQSLSVANVLRRFALPAAQQQWLPALLAESAPQIALALAEPHVLADPHRLQCRAERKGQHYQLSGSKSLLVDGLSADYLLLSAYAEDGPALFLVEASRAGVERCASPAMGLRGAALASVTLRKVRVPHSARITAADFAYQTLLDLAALGGCAVAVGAAQAALDYVVPYVNERQAFGEPISHRQGVAFPIANMAIELEGMRLLLWRACARADQGASFSRESYLARLQAEAKAMTIASDAVQLLGGHGFTQEHPVERWYRDVRGFAVLSQSVVL
ncbi:acyl-CoA dehydrogenase family protein [Atopomonas sediminilitoris]|uniref:acyl-CoA dehydrogenase family protein n=1 Tax=Atopomonas sediminilitoris TaxID=2919919 RepID=UPI001F4E4DBB|nr:acyl-CoA dehydrogenase family protein [Atopomonas sediminilitoris]MCJ8170298.1 acyl-CoA dehydrogenase family protein [Atopomonas sediminilitoris]